MNWYAVPVAVVAGITAYAAIVFIGLYFALAKNADELARREYLSFALTCISSVLYDVTSVGLYNANSTVAGIFWQRYQLFAASLLGISFVIFIWDFHKKKMPPLIRALCVLLGVLGLSVLLWDSPYTLTLSRPFRKSLRLFSHDVVYFEGETGVLAQALMGSFLVAYAIHLRYMLIYMSDPARRKQRGKLGFLLAAAIAGITATNDTCIGVGLYTSIYTVEYGMATVWMSMAYILLMRFGELQEAINILNSDLARTNADLVLALKQARESIRAKTEFLASISHELRTPLNAIINLPEGLLDQFITVRHLICNHCGAIFALEEDEVIDANATCEACEHGGLHEQHPLIFIGDPAKAQACLQTVAKAGRHLLGLVNNILDASTLELGRTVLSLSSFEPRALVNEVISSEQAMAGRRGIEITQRENLENEPLSLIADRVKIAQILYNLIGNAIKFSPDKGQIEVSIYPTSPLDVVICVRDRGIGIAPEHRETIFEKFRQVDSSATRVYAGSGLGLAISKGLVELHGGRIWVESSADEGSSFFVRLPRIPPGYQESFDSSTGRRI
jgi:signal transduction histidine kinase